MLTNMCRTLKPRPKGVLSHRFAAWALAFSLAMVLPAHSAEPHLQTSSRPRPNILFILADDLGWNDLGCTGGTLWETPALDGLARQGMVFSQAYSPAPICSASRAAILTGRSPARLHLEFVVKFPGTRVNATGLPLKPPPFTRLELQETTFAEALQEAGYRTGFFGKWHVTEHEGHYLGWSPTNGPKQQGFEVAIEDFGGHTYGAASATPLEGPSDIPESQFPPDSMTDRAIQFLRTRDDRPFCLMVSHFYVHEPVRAPTRWLFEKYKSKAAHLTAKQAAYGAFVETLDHHVGRLLAALDLSGLAENTLVVFTSDNGGSPGYGSKAPLRGCKWTLYEAGVRVPFLVRWLGVVRPGSNCDVPVIGMDLFPTFADSGNATLDPGRELDGQSLLALLCGSKGELARQPSPPLKNRPLLWHFPYYNPEPPRKAVRRPIAIDPPRDILCPPVSALRRANWKLLHHYETGGVELFDLSADPGETNDLASQRPELVSLLREQLDSALKKVQARLPEPNEDETDER